MSTMGTTFRSNGSTRLDQETDERSVSQIVSDLNTHVRELVKGEILMGKRELADNARSLAVPIGMAVGAALCALVFLFMLAHALAWALNNWMDAGVAYLVSGLVFIGVACGLAAGAKVMFERARVAPKKTIEDAKEDVSWIKTHAG